MSRPPDDEIWIRSSEHARSASIAGSGNVAKSRTALARMHHDPAGECGEARPVGGEGLRPIRRRQIARGCTIDQSAAASSPTGRRALLAPSDYGIARHSRASKLTLS
jgi:hypothetical protein